MTTGFNKNQNVQVYRCPFCIRQEFPLVNEKIQSKQIFHECICLPSWCNQRTIETTVICVNKRFIFLLQINKRTEKQSQEGGFLPQYKGLLSRVNLDIFDLQKKRSTELWHSGNEFKCGGLRQSHLLYQMRRLLNKWSVEVPCRIFLCLISLNVAAGTFEFCDAAVLHDKCFGWLGCTINGDYCEQPQLQVKFVAKNHESATSESHYYKVCHNRLVFIDKTVTSTCDYNPADFYGYHIFDKKGYKFRLRMKMNDYFGRRILTTDYFRVFVRDLEQPKKEPLRLYTQCQHKELKAVPTTNKADARWHSSSGTLFVPVFSQSLQHYYVYSFNATLLKWNRIEWLQFPINHAHFLDDIEDYPTICSSTNVLHAASANTLFLINEKIVEKNKQKELHREYYRLAVGYPDTLCDLAWLKIQSSKYKHLLCDDFLKQFK